jgi:hypothetical protein
MKKKIILLSIIIFPPLIYFFFELTQANFKKMPFFGPKTVNEKGDTVYYALPNHSFVKCSVELITDRDTATGEEIKTRVWKCDSLQIDTAKYPVYCILFLDRKLYKEGYKISGLLDYARFKKKDLEQVPLFFVSVPPDENAVYSDKAGKFADNADFDSIPVKLDSFIPVLLKNAESDIKQAYFKQKPVYVFDYFMVLVDKKRHIRGYYDPSFNAEVKRMIDEYKHLKIRDEYAQTLKQNDIKQNEKK